MRVYSLLLIFCLCVANKVLAQEPKFINEVAFYPENLSASDTDVICAVNVWKKYLLHPSDSLLSDDRFSKAVSKQVYEQLFDPGLPREYFIVHLLQYRREGRNIYIESLFQFENSAWNSNMVMSYFTIGAKPNGKTYKLFFLADQYLTSAKRTESKWITYYNHSTRPLTKKTVRNANNFCDSIAGIFNLTTGRKAISIMTDSTRTCEFFGHQFYPYSGNSFNDSIGHEWFIFDNKSDGFYRHELIHFLFSQYHPAGIISEGIATWLAGPSYRQTFESVIDSLKKRPYSDTAVLNKIAHRTPPYWQPEPYYALGGIIMQYAYKTGGVPKVMELMTGTSRKNTNIFDLVQKHFDLKNESPQDFLIGLIKAAGSP
jgi:hypothetical protein